MAMGWILNPVQYLEFRRADALTSEDSRFSYLPSYQSYESSIERIAKVLDDQQLAVWILYQATIQTLLAALALRIGSLLY